MALLGPLLSDVLSRIEEPERELGFLAVASVGRTVAGSARTTTREALPVTALLPRRPPSRGEPWRSYREDTLGRLEQWMGLLRQMGLEPEPLIAASAVRFVADPDHVRYLEAHPKDIELLELDPLLEATLLNDVPADIELPAFSETHPEVDGTGVTVAVLDTGADLEHPYLDIAESFSECTEPIEIPGIHGTHCAGIIGSRDDEFRGIAPGVRLVSIKVGRANGQVAPPELSRGFDRAADVGAHIVSVSIGFNHRPRYTVGGHGWSCSRGRMCQVCRSVDTAVRSDNQLVVVAAGNEHEHAEALRRAGGGSDLDTELCCPGQARLGVTVASIAKQSWLPANASSRGPASSGAPKPDLAAPGVNVTSTVPLPRGADGRPIRDSPRSDIFARSSGTSMATPVVAGMAALLAQRIEASGRTATPRALRRALMRGTKPLSFGYDTVGHGRAVIL